jgi:hypothetical protein
VSKNDTRRTTHVLYFTFFQCKRMCGDLRSTLNAQRAQQTIPSHFVIRGGSMRASVLHGGPV